MTDIIQLKQILSNTKRVLKHKRDKEILKGELFNVFSILKMESKENSTHSAFISELLNPKGTHLKKDTFLKLFLKIVSDNETEEILNTETAQIKVERNIGPRDDINKTGGRIDICLWDNEKKHVSIENKIYAGDQFAQIERYCNYRKGKNKVYYLTLFGSKPSIESRGTLIENHDYYPISYKKHITEWLTLCIKESVDSPILRETLKQYLILIKKLTYTMDNSSEKELLDVILQNYKEASFISENLTKAKYILGEAIRQRVITSLKEDLKNDYKVIPGNPTHQKFSQIWIKLNNIESPNLYFGIESFNGEGNFNGDLFIGIFNSGDKASPFSKMNGNSNYSKWWVDTRKLDKYNDCKMNLSSPDTISRISSDKAFQNSFVQHIVTEIKDYLKEKTKPIIDFLEAQKANDLKP